MNLLEEELKTDTLALSLRKIFGDTGFKTIIELKSDLIPRILFGAYNDYPEQIARLNYILSYINGSGNPVERVDLSLRFCCG